jgi:hypothetical protein
MLRTNINFIVFGLTQHWFENKYTVHEANTLTDAAMTIREALFYNIMSIAVGISQVTFVATSLPLSV